MKIDLPEFALVVLIGASGAGKSTFARKHFKPSEVISSDYCRALVCDDERSLEATADAFDVLHYIVAKRLQNKKLTVVDATSVRQEDRKPLLELAKKYHCLAVAIVLHLPEKILLERNATRDIPSHVARNHRRRLKRSIKYLRRDGFRYVHVLRDVEALDAVSINRQKLWVDKRELHGPFDIIGDVHGCADELEMLLEQLGYDYEQVASHYPRLYRHPQGRQAIFVGDLMDRGPRNLAVYGLVKNMLEAGTALCVPGNHDVKLLRKLKGRNVTVNHGLEKTVAEIEALPDEVRPQFIDEMRTFLDSLISHAVLDDGKLVVAHAGLPEDLQGRASGRVREFALYGDVNGEKDAYGLPIRYDWAQDYRGSAMVVYGHVPQLEAYWLNNTINIDTACVFGNTLTALRYPEKEVLSVPALQTYTESPKPLGTNPNTSQYLHGAMLDIADVTGKRSIQTRYRYVTLQAANSAAALEVMSRYSINPKWLIYLPPTMAAPTASQRPNVLEHPEDAFAYYRSEQVQQLICQEKHMGSRALVIVCRDEAAVARRFGLQDVGLGVCYTRTGRPFFNDSTVETAFIAEIRQSFEETGLWQDLATDWVLLDCELMPWSAKAQALLKHQYAAVGAAAMQALPQVQASLEQTHARGLTGDATTAIEALLQKTQARLQAMENYIKAYRHYCWEVSSVADLKLAPFHLLASEGKVHHQQPHQWHMQTLARYCTASPLWQQTRYQQVNLDDAESVTAAMEWWQSLTAQGGEGMVVKPEGFTVEGKRGLAQAAIKVRGAEYLRIIYGAEYLLPENMEQLRQRKVGKKRALASQEFVLGLEGLHRFIEHAPLRQVHACVFGVLALESEAVDPRL